MGVRSVFEKNNLFNGCYAKSAPTTLIRIWLSVPHLCVIPYCCFMYHTACHNYLPFNLLRLLEHDFDQSSVPHFYVIPYLCFVSYRLPQLPVLSSEKAGLYPEINVLAKGKRCQVTVVWHPTFDSSTVNIQEAKTFLTLHLFFRRFLSAVAEALLFSKS